MPARVRPSPLFKQARDRPGSSPLSGQLPLGSLLQQARHFPGKGNWFYAPAFAGGFGQRVLAPWGETAVKQFVQEALAEALKLEAALSRLRTERRYAILHYAPIQDTVEGEPKEIFPFLGCSRLEEPLNRYPLNGVFHGHAHHGQPFGKTKSGVPVYNVAHALMKKQHPDRPFHLEEVPV